MRVPNPVAFTDDDGVPWFREASGPVEYESEREIYYDDGSSLTLRRVRLRVGAVLEDVVVHEGDESVVVMPPGDEERAFRLAELHAQRRVAGALEALVTTHRPAEAAAEPVGEWTSRDGAARWLGVSVDKLDDLLKDRLRPAVRSFGRTVLVHVPTARRQLGISREGTKEEPRQWADGDVLQDRVQGGTEAAARRAGVPLQDGRRGGAEALGGAAPPRPRVRAADRFAHLSRRESDPG